MNLIPRRKNRRDDNGKRPIQSLGAITIKRPLLQSEALLTNGSDDALTLFALAAPENARADGALD